MQQDINLSLASGQKKKSHRRKLIQHHFTPAFLYTVWPKHKQPPSMLADMSEEETAIWVEMIGSFKGWKEAKLYAQSFKINCITGNLLRYLSVKSLRSELNIRKFGHRLEILAAIEKNEFTLMNPFIVSVCTGVLSNSLKNFYGSHSQRAKKLENTKCSENKAKKCLSQIERKTFKTSEKGLSYHGTTSSQSEFTYDRDPQNVGGGDIWMPKNVWILPSAKNFEDNCRVKEIISKSEHPSTPPSELPSARTGVDGEVKLDNMTKELVRGGKERLSALFSKAKSETTAFCKYNTNQLLG